MTANLIAQRVAGNVRAEMARQSISQTELAARLHRSQQSISRRIAGSVAFDVNELEIIAQVLGVTVEHLVADHHAPRAAAASA